MKLDRSLLAKAAGFECLDPEGMDRLESYAEMLYAANEKINLVSRSVDPKREIRNQITLSLIPAKLISAQVPRWIDIGSGGGFPVIPLAILLPSTEFTAVEQISKKAYFIERTIQSLGLTNLSVVVSPVEAILSDPAVTRWNVASIKAVTDLEQSLRWSADLLDSGGLLVTYKPGDAHADDESSLRKSGFKHKASLGVKELIDTIAVRVVVYEKL